MNRPPHSPHSSRRIRRSGQSVVEFALVAPLMLIILLSIVDFARIHTTMMSVESGAREAADYGTTLGAGKWQVGAPMDGTVAEMRKRACVATSNLPEYRGPDTNCVNPAFAYCVDAPDDTDPCGPIDPADGCDVPTRPTPCRVTVTLTYEFRLLVPVNMDVLGVTIGVPPTVTFDRDSTFAMTDIDLSEPTPTPTPDPSPTPTPDPSPTPTPDPSPTPTT